MSYRKLFVALNLGLLAAFALAVAVDFKTEWRRYQNAYWKMSADDLEKQAASAPAETAAVLRARARKQRWQFAEIRQVIAKDLGRVDRCVTCHVGMDEYANPSLTNNFTENPYKPHPKIDTLGKKHPFTKFGCTVCHEGQGLATTVKGAHGRIKHWESPMLEGDLIQGACLRCHQDADKLKGAEVAAKGKKLFWEHGCQGCHSVKGVGQVVSVDLGDIMDKPLERIAGFNFSRIKKDGKPLDEEEWNMQNWILGHLTNDPIEVTPNDPHAEMNPEPVAPSGMPDWREELGAEGAEAVTAYLMSMTAEQIPHSYYVAAPPKPEPKFDGAAAHGKFVFEKYGCAGCHGLLGTKGRRNYNAKGPDQSDLKNDMDKGREPTLTDVVGTYSHEELVKKIANGVFSKDIVKFNPDGPTPPLYMPAWKDRISPKELDSLATWLLTQAKKDDSGF